MARDEVVVKGLREYIRAADASSKEVKRELRKRLRDAGGIVLVEARRLLSEVDPRSAQGLRTSVRQRGVSVAQSKRTVTGKRPDFGALQMRDLLQARSSKLGQVEQEIAKVLDDIDLKPGN